MKLSQLLSAVGADCTGEAEISSLTCDSRQAGPGALFAAVAGARADGRAYIQDALDRGAAAVLCRPPLPPGVPGAALEDPRAALAPLAAEFCGHPDRELSLVAVTGTKGKTTTAHMLRDVLEAAGFRAGMIGTLGAFLGRERIAQPVNTTPGPLELHRLLRRMADGGASHVVMEVSSQAMKQGRAAGLVFDAALFLNLNPDHIGGAEHADFAEYRACKAALFRQCRLALGNADDPAWPAMAAQVPPGVPVIGFGFGPGADLRGRDAGPDPERPLAVRFSVEGAPPYRVPLPGAFNAANALAAVALARAWGLNDGAVRAGLAHVRVPGRCQLLPSPAGHTVLIDYAHNGESFRALLSALRPHVPGRLIAVFGAGGDRPKLRRRDMARAAARWADLAVLTADNPRSESVGAICGDIAAALPEGFPYEIVPDRRLAVFRALDLAGPEDAVLLLGKGHEEYIEADGVRAPFSERAVVAEYFRARAGKGPVPPL